MRNFLKNLKNKILKVSKSQSLMQIFDGVWCPEASCTAVGTYSPRVLSRITRTLPAFTLVVLMLVMGGFSVRACGATSSVNTAALWTANTYDAGDSVVWTAPNVTFKLHNGGNIELYMSDHILIQKNQHYTLEWRVASGYTIQVTQVSVRARSTLQSYITVGSNKSGNIIGSSYTTVNSQALNLGNSGSVDIYPESSRDDAIVHMDEITVTYTFSGLTYTVRFNANLDGASGSMSNQSFSFDESKALTANGFSKSGYKFVGWTTNSDGSGTFYADKQSVVNLSSTNGATVNLYGKWTNERTVTFDGTKDWGSEKEEYDPSSFDKEESHVTFSLKSPMKQYNSHNLLGKFKSHEYFFLTASSVSELSWQVDDGYTIAVNALSISAKGQKSSSKGYLLANSNADYDHQLKIGEGTGSASLAINCSTKYAIHEKAFSNYMFGADGTPFGNSGKFFLKATSNQYYFYTIDLTYSITPNEYTITLNDNGGHGGDGTHEVTFDAATGSLTNAPTRLGYTFTGYYTSGGTKIFNANRTVVSGVSTYTDGSGNWIKDSDVPLYAHWTPNNYTVTLDNQSATTAGTASLAVTFDANTNLTSAITVPEKTNNLFHGYWTGTEGSGTQVIDASGNVLADAGNYTDGDRKWVYASNVTLYACWISKRTPIITGKDTVMMVDGEQENAFSLTYAPTPSAHISISSIDATNNGDGKVIEYDSINNKIIAHNAGVATIYITQAANDTLVAQTSATYTYRVYKYGSNVTSVSDLVANVDANVSSSYNWTYTKPNANAIGVTPVVGTPVFGESATSFYYTLDHDVQTSVTTGSNVPDSVIAYVPSTKTATGKNKGVCTVHLYQPETYKYSAADEEFDVTISKIMTTLDGLVEPMLVDATPTIGSYLRENTSAEYPSEGTSNDFYYTITNTTLHTPTVVTGCAEGHEAEVIGFTPSTNTITAYNAGSAVLTIAQKETYKYTGDTLTLNVLVSKHTTEFTWNAIDSTYYYQSKCYDIFSTNSNTPYSFASSNEYAAKAVKGEKDTLFIYNVEESATITVRQQANYYWTGDTVEYVVTPVQRSNHVPFKLTNTNKGIFHVSNSTYVDWCQKVEDGHTQDGYIMGEGGASNKQNNAIIHFEGIPDTLYFDVHIEKYAGILPADGARECLVYESSDNISYTQAWSFYTRVEWAEGQKVVLKPTTRYIKFVYNGTIKCHYNNIQVGELEKFKADVKSSTLNFGTKGAKYGMQEAFINFDHANAGRITTAEILSGADSACFAVLPKTLAGTGRDMYGTNTLYVTFDNKDGVGRESTPYTATLRIKDNNGHTEDVTLTGRRWGKTDPTITFNQHHVPYYVNSTISNFAVSTNTDAACPLVYSSTNESISKVEDGKLYIYETKSAVTIRVTQIANADYNAVDTSITFTPCDKPNLTVPFQMADSIRQSTSVTFTLPDGDSHAWDDEKKAIRVGHGDVTPSVWGVRSFVVAFGGAPDTLTFTYQTSSSSTSRSFGGSFLLAPKWKVEQSVDGENWEDLWWTESNSTSSQSVKMALKPTTRYIQFTYNGNGYGYFGDINVTTVDGYKYMRASTGKYLSRGGKWGTQAVVDEFGVPVRVTRYTKDNVHDTTFVQFMDNREFLFEDAYGEVFTDNHKDTERKWIQVIEDGKVSVRRPSGKYVYVAADRTLQLTETAGDAMQWEIEDYTLHTAAILTKLDTKAASAARPVFGSEMNSLAEVRSKIELYDFAKEDIDIPHLNDRIYEADTLNANRTISGMPAVYNHSVSVAPGFYRLTVKALFQTAPDPVDWNNKQAGMESVIAYLYANDAFYPIKSRYDETGKHNAAITAGTSILKGGYYYPNNAAAAHKAFEDVNSYINDVYVYVEADEGEETGTINYGIVNPSYVTGEWLAYESFQLTRITRKVFIFEGNGGSSTVWGAVDNWEYNSDPAPYTPNEHHDVIIRSNVEVAGEFKVHGVTIEGASTVTIAHNGGLSVGAGGIKSATKNNFKLKASTEGVNKGKTGYLRVSPEYSDTMPELTMELYSIGYYNKAAAEENTAAWQYVGTPIDFAGKLAKTVFTRSWIYSYQESTDSWVNNRASLVMQPFTGYATTQYDSSDGKLLTFKGKIMPSDSVYTVDLAYTDADHGHNVVANSFAAPIDITQFRDEDFVNAEKTIYIFNTGNCQHHLAGTSDGNSAGQYTAIAIGTVEEMNTFFSENSSIASTIAPMQGFCVNATDKGAKMKFDYNRLVWNANYTTHAPKPMRSPRRATYADEDEQVVTAAMKITMEADGWSDDVYMLESERYELGYEDGYDAHKLESGNFNIFTVREEDRLAIDATQDFEGTQIGVRTGEATAYTMHFSNLYGDRYWSLVDTETEQTIEIKEGTAYTFFIEPNSVNVGRFYLAEREENAPTVTTDCSGLNSDSKVHKFIKDNQMYILKNGVLYNAMGVIVK